MRPNFLKVADGLEVAPALAELALLDSFHWFRHTPDQARTLPLLREDGRRYYEQELPAAWALIGEVRDIIAAHHGDSGRLIYCRVGLMNPGEGLGPHVDGIDGTILRRYQLALAAPAGVELVVDGEILCPKPGECWRIEVSRRHSIVNNSQSDRITILFDTES